MTIISEGQRLKMDMSPIPGVPYGHGTPGTSPGHLESYQAVLFVETHAVSVYRNLLFVIACPVFEAPCGVWSLKHDDVHGFRGTELTYRHLV